MRALVPVLAVLAVAAASGGCTPARRTGSDGATTRTDAPTGGCGARPERPQPPEPDAVPDAAGAPDSAPDAPPDGIPAGRLLVEAAAGEDGQVRLEALDDRLAIRLVPAAGRTLSVEPLGRIEGTARMALLMGAGCQGASDGRERVVALWTGEQSDCAMAPEPTAVLLGTRPPEGCAVTPAPAGEYTVSLFACGRYSSPLVTLELTLPLEPGTEPNSTPDSGPDGSS